MKIKYNGAELETITYGYWPEGVTLICQNENERGVQTTILKDVFCLHDHRAYYGESNIGWLFKRFAILPTKPAPRRLTNREVAKLCHAGWEVDISGTVFGWHYYRKAQENTTCSYSVIALRAPNSDTWLDPTSDLLEVEK